MRFRRLGGRTCRFGTVSRDDNIRHSFGPTTPYPTAGDLRAIRCSVRSRDDESEPERMPSLAHRSVES
jgi:hypothetical protein